MRNAFVAFCVSFLCLATPVLAADAVQPGKPLLVLSGRDGHITQAEYHRIESTAQWQQVWLRHLGLAEDTIYRDVLEVDVDRCTVIAAFRGSRTNVAGLRVDSVAEADDTITVRVNDVSYQTGVAGGNDPGDQGTPYAFIVLPKSDKKIILEYNAQGLIGHPPVWMELTRLLPAK